MPGDQGRRGPGDMRQIIANNFTSQGIPENIWRITDRYYEGSVKALESKINLTRASIQDMESKASEKDLSNMDKERIRQQIEGKQRALKRMQDMQQRLQTNYPQKKDSLIALAKGKSLTIKEVMAHLKSLKPMQWHKMSHKRGKMGYERGRMEQGRHKGKDQRHKR